MGAKRYKPEEIISKLREAEVLLARVDAIREVSITEQTYYLYGRLSRCKSISN